MGKKKIVTKSKEELLKERKKVESSVNKDINLSSSRVRKGRICLSCSYNNMIMTLTDLEGNTLFWSSAGKLGFKGTKKGTSFAASKVAEAISYAVKKAKIKEVKVVVEGIGAGRVSALKSLAANGLNITSIKDTTSIPHNGCRARGPRRN
jgi:small subunit ribosomal protein S11